MTDAGALEAKITQQVILAMKAHDAVRTTTLRLIKNALKNKAIEKREPLTPAEELQALATMIKQRRDSIDLAGNVGRDLFAVGQPDSRHLTERGVRFLGHDRLDLRADAAPERIAPHFERAQRQIGMPGLGTVCATRSAGAFTFFSSFSRPLRTS